MCNSSSIYPYVSEHFVSPCYASTSDYDPERRDVSLPTSFGLFYGKVLVVFRIWCSAIALVMCTAPSISTSNQTIQVQDEILFMDWT